MHTRERDNNSVDLTAQASSPVAFLIYSNFVVTGLIVLGCLVGTIWFAPIIDTAFLPAHLSDNNTLPIAHLFFNSVVPFAIDPWLELVKSFATISIPSLYWVTLIMGLVLLCKSRGDLLSAVIGAATAAMIFGLDRVQIGILSWIPLIVFVIQRFNRRGELPLLIVLMFLGMRLTYSAGPLVGIAMIAVSFFGMLCCCDIRQSGAGQSRRVLFATLAVALGALITVRSIPSLPVFDYPNSSEIVATVVADDGLAGIISPLVGPAYPMPIIDGASKAEFLAAPFWICVTLMLLSIPRLSRAQIYATLGLIFLVGIDVFTVGQVNVLTPLASISRLVPGLFLYPVSALILSVLIWRLVAVNAPLRAAVFAVLSIAYSQIWHLQQPSLPAIASAGAFSATAISSPSLAIIRQATEAVKLNAAFVESQADAGSSVNELANWTSCKATVSSHSAKSDVSASDLSNAINDSDAKSRISLGQDSGNTLTLCFTHLAPRAVWLDLGDFVTDFPQHFLVKDKASGAILEKFNPWLGSIGFTTANKLPFYGSQANVQIPLPKDLAPNSCLDFVLTKNNKRFDWSVAELRCLY